MSLLISGLNLPNDKPVTLFITSNRNVYLEGVLLSGKAVPVPVHGRLIESVELYGRAEDIKTKALSVCDKPQSWQFGVFWAIEQIEAALTNAPTIIPAEEEAK